jgi:hypothetical protein
VWVTHPLVDGLQRWRAPESAAPGLKPRERCVHGLRTRESLFSNLKSMRPASQWSPPRGLHTAEEGIRNYPSAPPQGAAGASNTPPPLRRDDPATTSILRRQQGRNVDLDSGREKNPEARALMLHGTAATDNGGQLSPLPYPHSSYCKVALARGKESKTKQPAPTRKLLSPSDHAGVIGIT